MTDTPWRLVRLLRECRSSGIARRALRLRLSALPPELARPHHRRLAAEALDPLATLDRAERFELPDGDIVVVWRGSAEAALQATLALLGHMFGAETAAALPVLLSLPEDADRLLPAAPAPAAPPVADAPAQKPLDPERLVALEAALAQADMARFVRRRTVWRHDANGMVPAWEKRTLSAAEIGATLAPDRSLTQDPWLYRRLTRTLERRMLALLASPGELRGVRPFALNLNAAGLLSAEFLRFDAALPTALRGQVVVGLLPSDAMADPAGFAFARDFAQARGYRVLLRRVEAPLVEVLPPGRLGVDLVQLRWSPALAVLPRLPAPPRAVVLARADHPDALEWGFSRGIVLFQGVAAGAHSFALGGDAAAA